MNEEARRIWNEFISANREVFKNATQQINSGNIYGIRNKMAELGYELTPTELKELVQLIQDTLNELDG